jgi:glutamate racemase
MQASVGVFDSGVGGLTVAEALHGLAPTLPIRYIADTARFPYGERAEAEIVERAFTLARWLIDGGASLLVVACNTATSAALEQLRDEFDVPVVGMEPPLKPAVERSASGRVALLVTEATARGDRLAQLVDDHANDTAVETLAMPGLADLVEVGEITGPRVEQTLRDALEAPLGRGADQVALGCTHYGFLRPVIARIVGDRAAVIDAAEPVARRARQQLDEHAMTLPASSSAATDEEAVRCSATGEPDAFEASIGRLREAGASLPPMTILSEAVR